VSPLLLSTVIFIATYVLIASERLHRTLAAMLGAVTVLLFHLLSQEEAFHAVDFNVIFLLAGMMIIAGVLRKTGVFQWLALRAAKLARGNPALILVLLCLVTAILSAFLDNVTTVVLIVPLTIFLAGLLQLNPVPFLIAQVLASNIGGSATLIGDPPNIMIGSRAGLDFVDFLVHIAPISLIILALFCLGAWFFYRRRLQVNPALREALLQVDERELITEPRLLGIGLFVLGLTILGFLLHGALGYEAATIALAGATLLIILARQEVKEVLREVEWASLFFFVGLFIVVEGVVKAGLIERLAQGALRLTGGDLTATSLLILWMKIGEDSKITLILIGAFFPVFTTVSLALRHVDRNLVEAARAFGLKGVKLLTTVQLPAVVPAVFSGLRLALAQAWLFLVAAELIASSMGLGFLLTDSQNNGRTDRLLLAIVLLAVIGKITDALLGLAEKWAVKRWA